MSPKRGGWAAILLTIILLFHQQYARLALRIRAHFDICIAPASVTFSVSTRLSDWLCTQFIALTLELWRQPSPLSSEPVSARSSAHHLKDTRIRSHRQTCSRHDNWWQVRCKASNYYSSAPIFEACWCWQLSSQMLAWMVGLQIVPE